ncbi:MAG: dimethyl sulfoxide reductase anchor subunit [Opitutaceae bacterium]|nr:dimethyl sulfoxide reductase anchor subunit [Opitutaceae bacterium]
MSTEPRTAGDPGKSCPLPSVVMGVAVADSPVPPAVGFSRPQSVQSFLAELLADQQRLQTPVARASAIHDVQTGAFRGDRFRDLIPLSAPGPGEQYAFQVDLDSCSGCKACVAGCHSLNGLDENETWRDVGLVLGGEESHPFQQTITTACHHCEDPACLNGCPVLAYEKDPITGVVAHLDDQCIGCSYCVLKCPYDVPKYNERLGIVRKCDMCQGRLAAGEAPACVQACPTQAITIVTVSTHRSGEPAAAEPAATSGCSSNCSCKPQASAVIELSVSRDYTRPTTRYVSSRPLPANLVAADAATLRPQHAHAALILLLVFTQVGLGLFIASSLSPLASSPSPLLGLAFYLAGLIASVAHLGQPFRAWRIFLGLRRSWLSREAVLLGTAFPLLALPVGVSLLAMLDLRLPSLLTTTLGLIDHWSLVIGYSGLAVATLGVFCSAMIYIDTRRRFWRPSQSLGRMAGTILVTALAFVSTPLTIAALSLKLALELITLIGSGNSARLQRGPLAPVLAARLLLGVGALALFAVNAPLLALAWFILGELAERTLFFQAVDSPKMPGMPS